MSTTIPPLCDILSLIDNHCILGDDCLNFRTLTSNPNDVTTLKEHLFWVSQNSKKLYWADKKSLSELNKIITLGKYFCQSLTITQQNKFQ